MQQEPVPPLNINTVFPGYRDSQMPFFHLRLHMLHALENGLIFFHQADTVTILLAFPSLIAKLTCPLGNVNLRRRLRGQL